MNDKDTKLAAVRAAQSDIHDAVNKLRNEHGLSFQSAWSTLEKTRPDLFKNLDKASDELKIEYGQNKDDMFFESQGLKPPTAPNNVAGYSRRKVARAAGRRSAGERFSAVCAATERSPDYDVPALQADWRLLSARVALAPDRPRKQAMPALSQRDF